MRADVGLPVPRRRPALTAADEGDERVEAEETLADGRCRQVTPASRRSCLQNSFRRFRPRRWQWQVFHRLARCGLRRKSMKTFNAGRI
jgi:hypothetical protein